MKLYLSSYRIPAPEELFKLSDKNPSQLRVAIIPNAKDYYATRARNVKIRQATEYLQSVGLSSGVVDLNNYNDKETLKVALLAYDMIWVVGGNTFCLRDAVEQSGFNKVIREVLEAGIIYIGESAGTCLAGNTLKGLESADDPEYTESVYWDGLDLVPKFILPHVGNDMFKDDIEEARLKYSPDDMIEITDTQALIISENKQYIVDAI